MIQLLLAAVVLPSALIAADAPSDRRADAHATIGKSLNGHVEGANTAFGYVDDMISYIASGSGCVSTVYKSNRFLRDGNRSIRAETEIFAIDWSNLRDLRPIRVTNSRNHVAGVQVDLIDGSKLVIGFKTESERDRLLDAVDMLQDICARAS